MTASVPTVHSRKWDGNPIHMPGIVTGMPLESYHSKDACIEPSISSSGLRTIFLKSPKHYWATSPYNDNKIEIEEKKYLTLGRAAHHLLFGEADFRKSFTVRPATINGEPWQSNKTICKGWIKQQEAKGLTILTMDQLENIKGMAQSLAEEPLVKAGILNGAIERCYFWKDLETGIWLKVRPDAEPTDSLDFADLKTTSSVMYDDIRRTIYDYGYHQQAALVGDACIRLLRRPMNSFSLVFIESKAPFCVRIVTLKDNDIALGRQSNVVALRTFVDCMKSKRWPGPAGEQMDATPIEMPEWAQKRIQDRIKLQLGDAQ